MLYEVWQLERIQSAKVTFKGISTDASRQAMYDLLYIGTVTYFPKFKEVTCHITLNTSILGDNILCMN